MNLSSHRPIVAALVALTLLAAGCSSQGPDANGSTTPTTGSAAPALTDEQLATAVVRVAQTDAAGNECAWGSGTILTADGTILTNFHVVEYDPQSECDYQQLVVSTTDATDTPPTPTYLAKVHAFDVAADLAVLRISAGVHGESVTPNLPHIAIGDSDMVQFGEMIKVLGFPGIGGETITLTEGTVSGFLSSPEVAGDRAWIKTATTIAGGNSGGAALNGAGQLIGVPTQVSAGNTEHAVDCRIIEDTNGDGWIDEQDTCVPTGGFINGVRPVNLAKPLLERASTAGAIELANLVREYSSPSESPSASPSEEPSEQPTGTDEGPTLSTVTFSSDVDENGYAVDEVVTLPSGATSICALFDYEGMVDGTTYDLIWSRDGEVQDDASVRGDAWAGGSSGSWYICVRGDADGLADGLWELAIYVDSEEPNRTGNIYVGDGHPPVDVEVTNGLDERICYLFVAPDESDRWGPDRLGKTESLDPGASATVSVGASTYDFMGQDCDGNELARVDDIDVQESAAVTLE